jgi:hypothetical protein
VLREEHSNTLSSMNKLRLVLEGLGKYKEAELLQRRALEGSEKVLRVEHPNTLTSVSDFRSVLLRQGKYKEAESM